MPTKVTRVTIRIDDELMKEINEFYDKTVMFQSKSDIIRTAIYLGIRELERGYGNWYL